jgi:hypothetical protein
MALAARTLAAAAVAGDLGMMLRLQEPAVGVARGWRPLARIYCGRFSAARDVGGWGFGDSVGDGRCRRRGSS